MLADGEALDLSRLLGNKITNMTVPIQLAKNGYAICTEALADTGANGFAFLDIFLAEKLAKHFQTHTIPLEQPCGVKGYDGKSVESITHLMILTMIIDGRMQRQLPFLIVRLGEHDAILGRLWLDKYGVLVDCRNRRLIWPEDVPLKDQMEREQFVRMPKRILRRGESVDGTHQADANRRDGLMEAEIAVSRRMTPVSTGLTQRKQYRTDLGRMDRDLTPLESRNLFENPEPSAEVQTIASLRKRGRASLTTKSVDIATIGSAVFYRMAKARKHEVFITSLSEIEGALEAKRHPVEEPELKEIEQQLPQQYRDYADVFSKVRSDQLPEHREYDHKIELEKNLELGYSPLYRMSEDELEAARAYILENLDKGFIVPSNAPFASPILMARKADGGFRFCVDYRKLNAITRKDRYPLPLIEEVFERLSKAKIFTKLDIRQGFHRIRMHPESANLTTFRCRYGTFKYEVMPFGLTNGPATFQRLINDIFMDYLDQFLIAFVDDLLIYSDNEVEHEIHVRKVLERLREAGLQASLKKCEFHVVTTKYLGFIVTPEGIKVDPAKIEVIRFWQTPSTVRGVQSFLGFCNFYRKFIRGYSQVAKPLHRLTRTDIQFVWDQDCEEAFQSLKQKLCDAPVLAHYDPRKPTQVETDASDGVVAAVLSQQDGDQEWHPVAYYSASMTAAEHNYDIHDKELLAIVKALREWRPELIGLRGQGTFDIWSDHRALEHFMTTKSLNARQARWCEFLEDYHFILRYRPGKANVLADTLTRRRDEAARNLDHRNRIMIPRDKVDREIADEASSSDLNVMTPENTAIARVLAANKDYARTAEAEDRISGKDSRWEIVEERLQYEGRLYVPNDGDLRARLLDEIHRQPSTAHPGRAKLQRLVKERFYWEAWSSDVRRYVDNCKSCKRTATRRDKNPGWLQPLPIPMRPWQHLSMDFMEFPPDKLGYDNVYVVVDRFSKRPVSIPCHKGVTATDMAKLWIRYVYPWTGLPETIVSDRGGQFVSEFWGEVCRILQIKLKLSTARHAQTDGQTEIANQYLQQRLRPYVNFAMDDWSEYLPIVDFAAASLPQESTGMSPFEMERGYRPRMSFDWSEPTPARKHTPNEKEARAWVKRLEEIWDRARLNLSETQDRQRQQANKHRREIDFDVGDKVYVSSEGWNTGRPSRKLDHQSAGPYKIVRKVGNAFELDLPERIRVHRIFSPDKLRRAASTEPLEGQLEDEAPAITVNGQSEWEIEKILDARLRWGKLYYRVSWRGHDPDPTWYPARDFMNAARALKEFHDNYPNKPGPPRRLSEWIEAAMEDRFVEEHDDDNLPLTPLEGKRSRRGG
jgi:transposase InsO family protein/predicted aspartyl protease